MLKQIIYKYEYEKQLHIHSVNLVDEDNENFSPNLFSVTKTRRWRAKTNIWW